MSEPITTEELLDEGEARTGLLRGQLLLMVAKSATIRHIAQDPKHAEKFVLKGGSLLTHVYGSPRQSIADADYYHVDPDKTSATSLERAFSFDDGRFVLDAEFVWAAPKGFDGSAFFEIDHIDFSSVPVKKRQTRPQLKVTISIRTGEWLDRHDRDLYYYDPLLADDSRFKVLGLSLEELGAEKVLGWSTKDLAKHFIDLSYLEREYGHGLDYEKLASLTARKLIAEKREGRYVALGIDGVDKLGARFCDDERIEDLVAGDWARLVANDILFLPQETARSADETLTSAANVERLGRAFWARLEPELARHFPVRR
jgi:hypothetical protein